MFFAPPWQGASQWAVLDAAFADGQRFAAYWAHWQNATDRPKMLHYVGLLTPDAYDALLHAPSSTQTGLQHKMGEALRHTQHTNAEGWHRLLLDGGQVSLTLCVGPLESLWPELHMQVDTVWATGGAWPHWLANAISRLCRPHTYLHIEWKQPLPPLCTPPSPALQQQLHTAGFVAVAPPLSDLPQAPDCAVAVPAWAAHTFQWSAPWLTRLRRTAVSYATAPSSCIVIGAGLAGASVARALALRGWQVTVVDKHSSPAAGASALPAGLMAPHYSADNSPLQQLTHAGLRLMRDHATRYLQIGQDWFPSGAEEKYLGAPPQWHPESAWVRPAALVRAWLNHPAITLVGNADVLRLQRHSASDSAVWIAQDANGNGLAQATHVVLANALDSQRLVRATDAIGQTFAELHGKQGMLSLGNCATVGKGLPEHPVRGAGNLIPHVPDADGNAQWVLGASFLATEQAIDPQQEHRSNIERLRLLAPEMYAAAEQQSTAGELSHWQGTRCISQDRLPLVGPLHTDLSTPATPHTAWISAALGARGLTLAALCAELLVAQMCKEPWPLPKGLAGLLDVRR